MPGHKVSEETRAKLREKRIGLRFSPEFGEQQRQIKTTHGHTKPTPSPTYISWTAMLRKRGRGITICARWDSKRGGSFANFLEDMGLKPEGKGLSRITNGGDYEPGNCQWTTRSEQQRNKQVTERTRLAHIVHGHARPTSPTYRSWRSMLTRTRPQDKHGYFARGITVCERWHSFENFLADMGERPIGKTLDRRDNDGNYEPANCRWATGSEQQRNKRRRVNT